jgi:hydrogenase 3 maturation protease
MKEIEAFIKEKITGRTRVVILGVGSELCADDAAGMLLIKKLKKKLGRKKSVQLIAGSTAPENFTGVINEFCPDIIFIVDAAYMGKQPGSVCPVQSGQIGGVSFSTHMLPFNVLLSFLRKAANCPVEFIGIQPKNTGFGEAICSEVEQAVADLAECFSEIISGYDAG